jgi:hypothetical protein
MNPLGPFCPHWNWHWAVYRILGLPTFLQPLGAFLKIFEMRSSSILSEYYCQLFLYSSILFSLIQNTCNAFFSRRDIRVTDLKRRISADYNFLFSFLINVQVSVRTAKKTRHFSITKINWLTLFKEIIAVYSENHTKHINRLCGQNVEILIVKEVGTCSYHWTLKN